MNVFFLGYNREQTSLIDFIERFGHSVREISEKITDLSEADLVISFGYQHIIKQEVIDSAVRPILNLHISFLPFNRGAHPNFWSWIDGTPSGVTIHEIAAGVDTGAIVARVKAKGVNSSMTFRETYAALIEQIESLFKENSQKIFSGKYTAIAQTGDKSYHAVKDLPEWMTDWDMCIDDAIDEYNKHAK